MHIVQKNWINSNSERKRTNATDLKNICANSESIMKTNQVYPCTNSGNLSSN